MSGSIPSTFANVLYDPLMAGRQAGQENALMRQQQEIGQADIEMVARAASPLLDMSPEAAAAAYPGVIAGLRAQGYAKHAPDAYPGHAVARQLVSMGIPADKQFEYGAGRTAASGAASGLGIGDSGATTPGAGGGGGTPSGPVMGPRGPGSATRGEAEGGPPAPGSPGAAVAQRTHDFWASKGFSEPQIAGIMAGGPGSESDFTPTVYGDNRTSYGLYQHHGPRLEGMRKYFGLSGDTMPTEQQQNEYAYWEISPQGPLARVGAALAQAKTPEEAATIWTRDFGVPADKTEIGRRARGAGRYAGLYGGAGAPPGTPGVQVGGDAPAPPGGAPGAAVPTGPGGFAAALAPPAVAASRPPPPVPGQRVSAIDAIQAGRLNAQSATPASAMPMMAGPGAGGPEVQPLRAPEPGWGTGTPGSYGYSGGSPTPGTVAPAAAPVAPVAPAQPPAAPAQPAAPQVPLAPTLPLKPSGLTAQQEQAALSALNAPGVTVARVNEITAHYQALAAQNRTYNEQAAQHNYERTRQAAGDVRQTAQDQRQAQQDAQRAEKEAQTLQLAKEKAAREAAEAAQLQKSKSDEADAERVLFAIAPKVRRGEELTEAEADQYDVARRRYARGPLQQVPDGKGGTITAFVGQEVPDRFPPLPGQKEYAGVKPIPGTEKQPDFAPANAMTAMLDVGEGNRKIVKALDALEAYPAGVGPLRGSQPNIMSNWTDPEGVKVRAAIGDVQGHLYHSLAGSAQSAAESGRLRTFVPGQTDDAETAKTKLRSMLDSNRQTLLDHYRAFGPDAGGRRQPGIEEEILATIPEAAVERLKKEPDTAKAFDRKFGRGAAKLALQNG